MSFEKVIELINAANYLNIPSLVDLEASRLAFDLIKQLHNINSIYTVDIVRRYLSK